MVKPAYSDLLINRDGSVYHLNLKPQHLSDVIITVSDPHRVFKVSQHFNDVDFEMNKGEYITHIGKFKGKRVTVISSGMGADNIEVLLNELDYLSLCEKKKLPRQKLKIIHLGTSSGLQDIPLGTEIFSNFSIGLDSLMQFYSCEQDEEESEILETFRKTISLNSLPYISRCSASLKSQFTSDITQGNSLSTPGIYAPQGRKLRVDNMFPNFLNQLMHFHVNDLWITNFETETAPFYALGRLLGHEVISISVITENKLTGKVSKDPEEELQRLIIKVLERI